MALHYVGKNQTAADRLDSLSGNLPGSLRLSSTRYLAAAALLVSVSWALLPSRALGDPPVYEITPERIERVSYTTGGRSIDATFLYRTGDDPSWGSPEFDDSGWTRALTHSPEGHGIGWHRIRLVKVPELEGEQLGLAIVAHGGPFEVYLDGELILKSGRVSSSVEGERGGANLVPVPLTQLIAGQEHLLAIRSSNHGSASRLAAPNLGFQVIIGRYDALVQNRSMYAWQAALFLVLTLLLSLQHLLFYLFYRKRRENLYFSLYTAILAAFFATYFAYWLSADALVSGLSLRIWIGAMAASGVAALMFLYEIFRMRRPMLFKILVSVAGAAIVWTMIDPLSGLTPARIVLMLLSIEALRVVYLAFMSRKPGAVLIASAVVPMSAFMVVEQMGYLGIWDLPWLPYFSVIWYCFLLLVVAMAIYLARDFAHAHNAVQAAHDDLEEVNRTLEEQVAQRTEELQASIEHLQSAQERLVQQEKLASLGSLTAGIAHEIKNPLNFVNNFGQLTADLIRELRECRASGDEEEIGLLLDDIEQNAGKVVEHGRRADGIVRSMLMHSRGSGGQREQVDLNALVQEYGGLAYHGMRAQRSDFNCDLVWDLDEVLPPIEAVPQDLGRVLLNILNNAFYAVATVNNGTGSPRVRVGTSLEGEHVRICIADNGHGIPEKALRHIFEPFFTTKPTGEGTGLGLSMSHDIIVRGHDGTLTVESEEGQGSTFVISLPATGAIARPA